MSRWLRIVAPTLVVGGAALVACSSFDASGTPTNLDGGDASGSDGPRIDAPSGCDLTKGPKESPDCIDDSVGAFVSPTGDDGATGGKAAPVKSIAKGVELAASKGLPRVYVCEGTYDTAVEIKTPLSLYGGLTCAWASSASKPKLAPPKGIALRVTKVTGPVVVEDFEVVGSADTSSPGDSAIAAFLSESTSAARQKFGQILLSMLRDSI